MRFLLTNDDGIDSLFLHELIFALRDAGHALSVVAPKREQSWIGAAKSRNRPVHVQRVDLPDRCRAGSPHPAASGTAASASAATAIPDPAVSDSDEALKALGAITAGSGDPALHANLPAKYPFACPTWVVDGTPSDCVNIALDHLLTAPVDGVISGINVGLNASLGFIIASGTVAGAFEGALHGLPSIAFSQDMTTTLYDALKANGGIPDAALHAILRASARHAARLAPELIAATPPRHFLVHNVNFPLPCTAESTLLRTVPARVIVPRLFSPADDDGTHRLVFRHGEDLSPAEPLTDRAALAAGHISHSILDYTKLGT